MKSALTLKRFVFAGWQGTVDPASATPDSPSLGELSDFFSFLDSLLVMDPRRRPSAREALYHPFFDTMRAVYRPPSFLENAGALVPHWYEHAKLPALRPAHGQASAAAAATGAGAGVKSVGGAGGPNKQ